MTRWHEDDLIGRLLDPDREGDPGDVEVIRLPAIAEPDDVLGREPGEPLLSPIIDEDLAAALVRWEDVRRAVGSYTFSAMYQQRPSAAKGAIFDVGWFRFWTIDPEKATEDGRVRYLDPSSLVGARWLDSWDMAFKDKNTSDYVVGQRWVRSGANRFLIAQTRGRLSFTATLERMKTWASPDNPGLSPYGRFVHQRLVEDKANGTAIIDTLHDTISGLKPVNPRESKVARARAVTPEVQSGNVYLPHPSDPGNEWVRDLLIPELRNFPNDVHDDQVDAFTQALEELRDAGQASISVPGRRAGPVSRDRVAAAATDRRRR